MTAFILSFCAEFYIRKQLLFFVFLLLRVFKADPIHETLQESWADYSGGHYQNQSDCYDELFMHWVDLQTKCEGDDSSDHSTVPTHFQLVRTQWKRSLHQFVDQGHGVQHDGSDYWHSSQDHQGHQDSSPFPIDWEDGSPQIREHKCLSNITDSLKGQTSSFLRLLRNIHKAVVAHDNGTSE